MNAADSLACSLGVPATIVIKMDGQVQQGGIDCVDIQLISEVGHAKPIGVMGVKPNGTPFFVPWENIYMIASHGPRETPKIADA